jgi:hypothetical protein
MGSGIGAVDLDHCVNGDSNIEPWAEQLHAEAGGAYKETTVSGGGLRFIGTAEGEDLQRKFTFDRKTGAGIELYRNTNRYITISGLERGTCPALPPLDGLIDTLFSRYGGKAKQSGGFNFNDASPQDTQSYDDLTTTARRTASAARRSNRSCGTSPARAGRSRRSLTSWRNTLPESPPSTQIACSKKSPAPITSGTVAKSCGLSCSG